MRTNNPDLVLTLHQALEPALDVALLHIWEITGKNRRDLRTDERDLLVTNRWCSQTAGNLTTNDGDVLGDGLLRLLEHEGLLERKSRDGCPRRWRISAEGRRRLTDTGLFKLLEDV